MIHERKVLTLPETGKCVVAHPNREAGAIKCAEQEDCPYMLRRIVPDEPSVFVMDLDAMSEVIPSSRSFPAEARVDLRAMRWQTFREFRP